MGISRLLTVLVILVLVAGGLLFFADNRIHAQGDSADSGISGKLDEILKNQKTILQNLDSLKAELNIIKIRITQQQ